LLAQTEPRERKNGMNSVLPRSNLGGARQLVRNHEQTGTLAPSENGRLPPVVAHQLAIAQKSLIDPSGSPDSVTYRIERGRSSRSGPVRSLPIQRSAAGSSQRGRVCSRPEPAGLASGSVGLGLGRGRENSGQVDVGGQPGFLGARRRVAASALSADLWAGWG